VLLSTASIPKKQMEKKKLVVILHGYTSTEGSLAQLMTAIRNEYKDVDILIPGRPGLLDSFRNTKWFGFMGLFSTDSPDQVVEMIRSQIAEVWNPDKHESVVLVGHSIGAVLARRVYLSAWQEEAEHSPKSQGESD
jgi:triacylglycerol esterase/lipase EstA (alpha/beta hydrolase family)